MSIVAYKKLPTATPRVARAEVNVRRAAFVISIALHLLGFLLVGFSISRWPTVRLLAEEQNEPRPPLVFTLAETPESARRETPPENATHVSDKNAVAQNPNAPENLPVGEPFAAGDLPNATAAPSPRENSAEPENAANLASKDVSSAKTETSTRTESAEHPSTESFSSTFNREFLTGGQRNTPRQFPRNPEPGMENQQSRAPELGSFSLNTYEWNFAPYMLWLKNRIQRNIYPPPAFTHMGIISGRTYLRFRILRDGTLQAIELLGYEGHKSLMETSVRAVQLSVPLQPLPSDFPENYLEVTALFDYIIKR